jgi:hypothetical protein
VRTPAVLVAIALLQTATIARAKPDDHASFFAGAGITAGTSGLSASIAGRFALGRARLGSTVAVSFGLGRDNVSLRPLATCDYDVSAEKDVRIWLGAALGPSFSFAANTVGLAALATLDVAVPLATHFAFDVVVRAGFDEPLSIPSDRPEALGVFALGVTWEL